MEESARVQDGEMVWIQGGTEVLELMQRVAVGRVGGQPLVTVFSNEMLVRWYEQVPEGMDERRDEWWRRLPEMAQVLISFDTCRQSSRTCSGRSAPPSAALRGSLDKRALEPKI